MWFLGGMNRYVWYILAFSLPLATASGEPARLESSSNARVIRDYARITFEWPRPVYLTATTQGSTLLIEFERPVTTNAEKVVQSLSPYIKSATSEAGGKRLRIEMAGPYKVRSFVSEQISGVDILDVKKAIAKKEASPPTPLAPAAQNKPITKPLKMVMAVPVKPINAGTLAAIRPAAGEEKAAAPAEMTDAAAIEAKKAETAATQKEQPKPAPAKEMTDAEAIAKIAAEKAAAAVPPEKTKTPAKEPTKEVAAAPAAPAKTEVAAAPAAQAPASETAAPQAANNEPLKIEADISGEVTNITFPWKERVAAAGFTRDGALWLVFNRAATTEVDEANIVMQPGAKIEQIPAEGATVLLIHTRPDVGMVFQVVEGSPAWQVSLYPAMNKPETAMNVSTITEEGLPAHVLVSALETPEHSLRIKDPMVGDELLVMPMYSAGKGILPERSFVDFKLLEAWQGIVVQAIADDTVMLPVRNGVRIATESGAHISKDLPPVEAGENVQAKMDANAVLFPYDEWKAPAGKDYQAEIDALIRSVARDRAAVGAVSKYHRAAQLYLSEGRAVETIGMIQMAKRLDPDYYVDNRMSAMEGAANFLLQRYQEAYQLFNTQELEQSKEAIFWRSMLGEVLGTPNQAFNFEEHYTNYIVKYPPLMRQRLAILAADRAIGTKDYNTALKIFDQLNKEKVINEVADYVNYLMGTISVANGQVKDGFAIWEKLLDQPGREFVKTRAEYALIAERYARQELSDDETIDKLERLNLRWRGDVLELNALKLLSSIYDKKKDWPNALRVWKAMNDGFPNTVEAVAASRNMDDAFRAMFDRDEVGSMNTLDQLFLFHEYRELLTDDDIGDRISEKLVQKMLTLDLLDEATDLLDKRMRNRFERDVRSKAGAQLAKLFLMNKQPLKALYALQDSVYGQNAPELNRERNKLAVQAMIGMKRYDDALELIGSDKSADSEILRSEVYWQKKNWTDMIATLENVIKERTDVSKPVDEQEATYLVKLALGYLATNEPTQLQYLRDYFMPLIEGNSRASLFEFLTRPNIPVTPDTFEKAMHQIDETQLFLHSHPWGGRKA